MNTYLITYDLNKPGQVYQQLYQEIKSLGVTIHGMQNVWFLESNYSAKQIRDSLKQVVDSNDKIFVCAVVTWATSNLPTVASWLNS